MGATASNDAALLARLRGRYGYVLRLERRGKRAFVILDDDGLFEATTGDKLTMYRSILYVNGARLPVREQEVAALSDGTVLLGLTRRYRYGARRCLP